MSDFTGTAVPPTVGEWRGFESDCATIVIDKYAGRVSPYIKSRIDAGYYSPEDYYETLANRLITSSTKWLDVGCGRAPFPNNLSLSRQLSERCAELVGVDPDDQLQHNRFVDDRHHSTLEELQLNKSFDLVTARMVVEHVRDPDAFAMALARVTHQGSLVAILTVNWLSITTLAAHCTPFAIHKLVKAVLWGTRAEDSFPTEYRLNRRRDLQYYMQKAGFEEVHFETLSDASLFWRISVLRNVELHFYRLMRRLGRLYPESCLLAIYRRQSD
jgi:2-polyprenyl-3-methyl-5-hydroxy-6-metoxy-1,4-benzoquinol methylase